MIVAPHARTAPEWRRESLRRGWSRRPAIGRTMSITSHPSLDTILRKAAAADGSADLWCGDDRLVRYDLVDGKVRKRTYMPAQWGPKQRD